MANPGHSRQRHIETIEAVLKYGNATAAAAALGVKRETMQSRVQAARAAIPGCLPDASPQGTWAYTANHEARRAAYSGLIGSPPIPEIARPPDGFVVARNSGAYDASGNLTQQWVGTVRDSGDSYDVPAGHVVKGESALLDPSGRVLAKWVKTREGAGEGLVEALKAEFASFAGTAPAISAPIISEDDTLTLYPMPDLHLGMYAWGRETGDDYDVDIAVKTALDGISALVEQSRPSSRAVILGLGDYFHANDAKAVTPGSGNRLDVDGRWAKVFAAGAKLAVSMIDIVARKHAVVEVVFLPGNHDPDAAISLTVALALYYSENERVDVHQEPGVAWYARFGEVLLGATHGHTMKPDRMAMMLASDRPEDWGETKHRHFFFGHIHSESAKEVGAVRVESFSAPTARDAWNNAAGYRAGRALSAITFHRTDGEIGRHRVNIVRKRS